MQSKVHLQLKNKTVKDLYWLIFSDSPLSETYDIAPYALFPKSILKEWRENSRDYFLALDENHQDIERFLNRKKNNRLGFYAEALLSYFFQTYNQVELLLQNFQIIEENRTIGEIDFVIRYNQKVIHLECAVKYYMLKNLDSKNNASQWVGPRLRDNLELKLNKIVQHQLKLGTRKEVLNKINVPIDNSYLFLKGIFFSEEPLGSESINRNEPNQFIRQSNLKTTKAKPIKILKKPNWLSSTQKSDIKKDNDFIPFDEQLSSPEMVLFDDGNVRFIVADDWGNE